MKALLDTHTFLWWVAGSDSLSDQARGVLEDRTNQLYLSAVVSWEIAILVTNRKIALAGSVADFVNAQISLYELEPLPISLDHTFKLGSLPYDPDHRDPWDRMLVAQAQAEDLVILTLDKRIEKYSVKTLW